MSPRSDSVDLSLSRQRKLDERLRTLADLICAWTPTGGIHIDIGSDHAFLLQELLQRKHIRQAIAIEKCQQPFENSRAALQGLPAEVRLGDGFAPIRREEATSASLAGMGGRNIVRILSGQNSKIGTWLFVQPNKREDLVRGWAYRHGFHLVDEVVTSKFFTLIAFQRSSGGDSAYRNLPLRTAMLCGPRLLSKRDQNLKMKLIRRVAELERLPRHCRETEQMLADLKLGLALLQD